MSHAFAAELPWTIEAFEAWADTQPQGRRYELIDGEIVAMTAPTQSHAQIVVNIGFPLEGHARQRNCRAVLGNVAVQASDDRAATDKPEPDLIYRCGPIGPTNYVTDPLFIVEVLSASTQEYDRGGKLLFYKTLPSVQCVALVYQTEMRVELYRRNGAEWKDEVLKTPDGVMDVPEIGFSLALTDIYRDIPGLA